MLTQEKIAAVKKQLRSGIPEGEIKNELLKEGVTEEEMKILFAPHQYDMRSWYLLSAIVLLVIGLWAFAGNRGLLPLLLSGLMFFVYYREYKKHNT